MLHHKMWWSSTAVPEEPYFRSDAVVHIPGDRQYAEAVYEEMVRLGAGAKCYAVSTDDNLDGKIENLLDALGRVVGRMDETLLYCWQGQVGYFEGHACIRVILRKAGV
jgi:hypothetical protein